jgi:hypothetical protein
MADGKAEFGPQPFNKQLKRALARPWNYFVKKYLKWAFNIFFRCYARIRHKENNIGAVKEELAVIRLEAGDWVRVRSLEEIQATLNPFKELKGCAFLEDMKQYCDTHQRVLKPLERFLDERDYQVKKARGIILLEGIYCQGTPVFGRCDRSCLLFWREEWLEKITAP